MYLLSVSNIYFFLPPQLPQPLLGQSELGFSHQNWVFQKEADKLILIEVHD